MDSLVGYFKQRTSFDQRRKHSEKIKTAYPSKIPVIIERCPDEKNLPSLDNFKYLVPACFNAGQLMQSLRFRLQLKDSDTLFLLVNGRNIVGCTTNMAELYENEADGDGFLYISFASQEVFGN